MSQQLHPGPRRPLQQGLSHLHPAQLSPERMPPQSQRPLLGPALPASPRKPLQSQQRTRKRISHCSPPSLLLVTDHYPPPGSLPYPPCRPLPGQIRPGRQEAPRARAQCVRWGRGGRGWLCVCGGTIRRLVYPSVSVCLQTSRPASPAPSGIMVKPIWRRGWARRGRGQGSSMGCLWSSIILSSSPDHPAPRPPPFNTVWI